MYEYFVNIFLEMSHITLYLANSEKLLVPVPGSWDSSFVVYGGLKVGSIRHDCVTQHGKAQIPTVDCLILEMHAFRHCVLRRNAISCVPCGCTIVR